jgi:hypothetical protein
MLASRCAGFAVALLLCSCQGGVTRRKVGDVAHRVKPAAPLRKITVDQRVGSVRLVPAIGAEVQFAAEVWLANGRPDTDFTADFAKHVQVGESAGVLAIADAHTGPDSDDWELRLTVQVPEGLDYQIELDAGQVAIELATANEVQTKVGTGQANVVVAALTGAAQVELASGQAVVTVNKQGPARGLRVEVGAGTIHATLPPDYACDLSASVTAGDVEVVPRYGVRPLRDHASSRANGRVGAGGPSVRLSTSTGRVVLE